MKTANLVVVLDKENKSVLLCKRRKNPYKGLLNFVGGKLEPDEDSAAAAEELQKEGLSVEVLDPRTLYPLDKELIERSIAKTHKAVIVTEENRRGGYGGELSAIIAEEMFDYLDGPVVRIGALDSPVPFAPVLEQLYIPNSKDIVKAVREMA